MPATSAHVRSISAVAGFRASLCTFDESALRVLGAIEQVAERTLQWLEHDVPLYWRQQVRLCYDNVARTRASLDTCRMRTVGGRKPACIEEQMAFRAAKQKLRDAEEKIEIAQKWANRIHRELDEYRGRVMKLRLCLECDVPRTMALLDRVLKSLEAYIETPIAGDGAPTPVPSNDPGTMRGIAHEKR
jgi:hypothetical protein